MLHLDISYEYISKSVDPTIYEVARECRGPFVGLRAFFFSGAQYRRLKGSNGLNVFQEFVG